MKKVFLYKKEGKEIVVTDVYAMVDDDDYVRISANRWYIMKLYHCDTQILYARRYEWHPEIRKLKAILMHREILGATQRQQKVDHADGDGLNNQKNNIRIGTHSENMSNRKVAYNKKIKHLGVFRYNCSNGYKYRAALKKDGVVFTVQGFDTPELAAIAYNQLVNKHNPVYGRLNLI